MNVQDNIYLVEKGKKKKEATAPVPFGRTVKVRADQ